MPRKRIATHLRRAGRFVAGFAIIVLCLASAHLLLGCLPLPLPAPVLGLVLYAALLAASGRVRQVSEGAASLFTSYLGAFIVPPFMALWLFRSEVEANLVAVLFVITATSLLSAVVTASVFRLLAGGGR